MKEKEVFEIDGENFNNLEGFYDEISRVLVPGEFWGRNLDALVELFEPGWGFGTPDEGFVFKWKNSELSRKHLGDELYDEIVRIIFSNRPKLGSEDGVVLILC